MIVLVTGATAGFGTAIARRFAADGARVIAAGRRAERLEALKAELGADKVLPLVLDVRDRAAVMKAVEGLPAEWAAVDVLVNNAGLALGLEPAQKADLDDWDTMVDTNVKGLMYLTRAVLPGMRERGFGRIVSIGSIHALVASPYKSAYVAAKHGLEGLAKVIAKEGAAYNIRSNVICPGFVRTPLVDKQIPEQAREFGISEEEVIRTIMLKDTVEGEFTTLDDVANVALTLAAFETNALTGQSIVVSHGWFMQ